MGLGIANLSIALKADVDDYNKAMATARETIQTFEQSALQAGRAMRRVGTLMTGASAVSVVAMQRLVSASSDLENKYRELRTISGNTAEQQEGIRNVIENLSEEFAYNGGQIEQVDSAYQAFSAGIVENEEDLKSFLTTTNQLSSAGLINFEESTKLVSLALNTYGMSVQNASEVSDDLFTIIDQGAIRGEELAGSFGTLLPFANELGVSFDEISASMSFMSTQFDSSRRAAFAIRSSMQQILKPSNALKSVFAEMGMEMGILDTSIKQTRQAIASQKNELNEYRSSLTEAQVELQGLKDAQDEMASSMRSNRIKIKEIRLEARKEGRDLTEEEKSQIEELELANEELRLQQMKNRQQVEQQKEEVSKYESEVSSAEETLESLRSKEEQQQAQLETQASVIGDQLRKEYGGLVPLIREIGARAEESSQYGLQDLITNQRALQFILPILNDETGKFNETLKAFKNNSGAAKDASKTTGDSLRKDMKNSLEEIKNELREVGAIITSQLEPILSKFSNAVTRFTNKLRSMDESLKQDIAQFMILTTAILGVLGPMLMVIGTITIMVSLLGTTLIPIIAATAAAFGLLAGAFKDIVSGGESADTALSNMRKTFSDIKTLGIQLSNIYGNQLAPAFSEMGSAVRKTFSTITNSIQKSSSTNITFIGTVRSIADAIGSVISYIASLIVKLQPLVELIVRIGVVLYEALGPGVRAIIIGLVQVIEDVISQFVSLFSLLGGGGNTVDIIVEIVRVLAEALGALLLVTGKLIQRFSGLIAFIITLVVPFGSVIKVVNGLTRALRPLIVALQKTGSVSRLLGRGFGKLTFILRGKLTVAFNKLIRPIIQTIKNIRLLASVTASAMPSLKTTAVVSLLAIEAAFNPIRNVVAWLIKAIGKTLVVAFETSFKVIKAIMKGYMNFVKIFAGAVISSISRFIRFLKNTPQNIRNAFTLWVGIIEWVLERYTVVTVSIIGVFEDLIDGIISIFKNPVKVLKAIGKSGQKMVDKMVAMLTPDGEWLADLLEDFKQVGKDMMSSIAEGIKEGISDVKEATEDGVQKAKDLWPGSPAEEGPWSRSGDPPSSVGSGMIGAIAKGMSDEEGTLKDKLSQIVSMDTEASLTMPSSSSGSVGFTISEGAVIFEEGAFKGIEDDDIPDKVGEEIEKVFQDILDEANGVGE